jgi:hypothetical protein
MNKIVDSNQQLISEISNWIEEGGKGLFVTLNNTSNDRIQFEQNLSKLAHKLNDFCYGRAYKRKEKRLKIIGSIEIGSLNNMIHAHLIVAYSDDMTRSVQEISNYVRTHWYNLIGLTNINGNMVEIKTSNNSENIVKYIVKDTKYLSRLGDFNILTL